MKKTLVVLVSLLAVNQARNYERAAVAGHPDLKIRLDNRQGLTYQLTAGQASGETFDRVILTTPKHGWNKCQGERVSSPWASDWVVVETRRSKSKPLKTVRTDASGNERRPISTITADAPTRDTSGPAGITEVVVHMPQPHYEEWRANCPQEYYRVNLQLNRGRNVITERWWTKKGVTYHQITSENTSTVTTEQTATRQQ